MLRLSYFVSFQYCTLTERDILYQEYSLYGRIPQDLTMIMTSYFDQLVPILNLQLGVINGHQYAQRRKSCPRLSRYWKYRSVCNNNNDVKVSRPNKGTDLPVKFTVQKRV
jgi:hypothetical protein